MPKRYRTVLLVGAPGAGKGTQGAILGRIPGFFHCACGDVFRNINLDSDLGKIFYEYSSRGELVPDDVTVKMWAEAIRARTFLGNYKPKVDLLVLDGIPRTVPQTTIMEQYIDVLQIIHLVCRDRDAMVHRLRRRALKENRMDDADEKVIRNRWEVYERETYPVLEHYDQNLIAEVDALNPPAQVLHDVLEYLVPVQNKHFESFGEIEPAKSSSN